MKLVDFSRIWDAEWELVKNLEYKSKWLTKRDELLNKIQKFYRELEDYIEKEKKLNI